MTTRAAISALLLSGLVAIGSLAGEHERTRLFNDRLHAQEPTPPEVAPVVPLTPTVEAPTFGLKDRYEVGEPVVVSLLLPAGQKLVDIEWELPLRFIEPPDSLGTIYVWPVGAGSWQVRANYIVDGGGKLSIRKVVETLTVGDPEPPEPPKPLIEIAGTDAPKLSTIYGKLSAGSYTSLAHFHGIEAAALADPDFNVADNPVVPVIRERLEKIAPFDGAKLIAELKLIAGELGKAPEPNPDVVEGKRFIVVLRETGEQTAEMGRMIIALRSGTNAEYLRSKGHTLYILDDDSVDEAGQPVKLVTDLKQQGVALPAVFVLEPSTKAVIAKQPLPATAADVMAFVKANGG